MCGIFFDANNKCFTPYSWESFIKSKHRGPDESRFYTKAIFLGRNATNCSYGFHRLSITDLTEYGNQPFVMKDGSFCICNGEIYNRDDLARKYLAEHIFQSESDCEILLPLYCKFGENFVKMLDGEFSLIMYLADTKKIIIARDPIGVRPLYFAETEGHIQFASELKSLNVDGALHFPPGSYAIIDDLHDTIHPVKYFNLDENDSIDDIFIDASKEIRTRLELAVKKRLSSKVPIGCLLSGGIDSSGIAVLASKYSKEPLETFTCLIEGLENEDARHAKKVATLIGSKHHEIKVTLIEVFEIINKLIYVVETHNMEMIPNLALIYLVAKYIKENTDVRVILDGTGPDELLGGYWFFKHAPDKESFDQETIKQLNDMHKTELLGDRALASFGLETRYPYLDKEVVSYIANLPAHYKQCGDGYSGHKPIEKCILRLALQDVLPASIVWREKLGMTHGAGKKFEHLFDEEINCRLDGMKCESQALSHDRIIGLEGYYKNIFNKYFPYASNLEISVTPSYWRINDPLAVWR
ncbi:asparagine synthase (glutamine-hydrolyzing) [Sodalis sp. RH14]|uniref:asparagine synthase (glutamine-hydrolyzing) n=1 Tax=Sodalis sp. RH14 TaxID=3394329 RepID=UPI0039B40375